MLTGPIKMVSSKFVLILLVISYLVQLSKLVELTLILILPVLVHLATELMNKTLDKVTGPMLPTNKDTAYIAQELLITNMPLLHLPYPPPQILKL